MFLHQPSFSQHYCGKIWYIRLIGQLLSEMEKPMIIVKNKNMIRSFLEVVKLDIRVYRQSDKDAVISLWKEVFNLDKDHNDPELAIEMKVKQNDGLFFVVEENSQIIGTILAGFDGHRGWLYSLAVHPDFRRRGIGSALVEKALDELKKQGCLKVNLQIYSENHDVVEFYEKNDFLVEKRISMGKKLY